jgi:hypothetical protein
MKRKNSGRFHRPLFRLVVRLCPLTQDIIIRYLDASIFHTDRAAFLQLFE